MLKFNALLAAVTGMVVCAGPAAAVDVKAAVLRIDYDTLLPISRYEYPAEDLGFAGAALADQDNGTTGQFMGHTFETETVAVAPDGADSALADLLEGGTRLIVVMAEAEDLLRLTDAAEAEGALVFNALAQDTALRDDQCRGNLLHTAPSNAMTADAVMQFAVWKKWTDLFLVAGSNPEDEALAGEYRRAATKFGAEIVEERTFEDTGGARRTDSGHVLVQRQLPVFMQDAEDHDVVIAADASDVFAEYLPYHLWTPRPVMGSGGLVPRTIHGAHEAWGATQFQNRFEELANRYPRDADYDVWLALRVVGEAVSRTGSADPQQIRDYALSDAFELGAFKGQPLTFRTWNGQMRQPILLYDGAITVSVSPQEGFLHQRSPLDSMGLDQPESACTAFN